MTEVDPEIVPTRHVTEEHDAETVTSRHVRGSSLLLLGRAVTMLANFVIQILVVRHLAKGDYGLFAYGLSIAVLAATLLPVGLGKAAGRFVPLYDEHRDYGRMLGTIAAVFAMIGSLSLAMLLVAYGFLGVGGGAAGGRAEASLVLGIMLLLAPLQAVDGVLLTLFAAFASPRVIFFRKSILQPALNLAVVALLVLTDSGVAFLAAGYVVAGAIGIVLYTLLLLRVLSDKGTLREMREARLRVPFRDLFIYTIPLLSTDVFYLLLNTADAILVDHYHGATEVAALRVVQPLAGVNQLVVQSFMLLFLPAASRLFARRDQVGMRHLYWQTAVWIAVIAFPPFLATFVLAEPVTVLLYEERYRSSAILLALLSLGFYFDAAIGYNVLTLQVFGSGRRVLFANLLAVVFTLVSYLLLIPPFGALGAASASCLSLIFFNVVRQLLLRSVIGINFLERRFLPVYATITVSTVALLALQSVARLSLLPGLALATLASLLVLAVSRRELAIGATFPELARIPVLGRFMIG